MAQDETDQEIRAAAFARVRQLTELHGHLTSRDLRAGFEYRGQRIPLINPQRGIFKPRQLRHLLSIRTVYPRVGARVWYDDQRNVHQEIFDGEEAVGYSFMGTNPDAHENRWLREAMQDRIPIIYFLGASPGIYQAIVPSYIVDWDGRALKANVAFGAQNQAGMFFLEDAAERRYALREVKQRLHQASFREAVIAAYKGRCALSGLPEPLLLDAAHIVPDTDEQYGHPIVPNGIPLSKTHHAAFDGQLIGIDPDFRIHVAERLMRKHDGPTLEALKLLNGNKLRLPSRKKDYPDRDRLELRFQLFKDAA